MSNTIKLGCTFCFKGRYSEPSLLLDLDAIMEKHGRLPDFYPLLAQANDIGLYSYEYEMLLAEDLQSKVLSGWVGECVDEQAKLDVAAFEQRWQQYKLQQRLQSIAGEQLGDALAADPKMLAVLEQAYWLDRQK